MCPQHRAWLFKSQGLAEAKDELGAPLCPCRHYDDKQAEADQGFWNCPCVPMRERKVSNFIHEQGWVLQHMTACANLM